MNDSTNLLPAALKFFPSKSLGSASVVIMAAATLCLCTGGVAAFATSPSAGGADWKLRFTLTVLLPHRT